MEDIAALVEAARDAALRRWTSLAVENESDAAAWVRSQERDWETGDRLAFAVLEVQPHAAYDLEVQPDAADVAQSGAGYGRLVGSVVFKGAGLGRSAAEVGYWTAAYARGRAVAPRALETLTDWAFAAFAGDGLERLELLHQVDNAASCRVARKTGYDLEAVLPAAPPEFPLEGHVHVRHRDS